MNKWFYKIAGLSLVVFYYLTASEIWPYKRVAFTVSDLIRE